MKCKFIKTLVLLCLFLSVYPAELTAQDTSETKPKAGTTQTIGDIVLVSLPLASVSSSLIIGDNKGAWQFTKGFLLTTGMTYALKFSINKQRPDMSNDNSFPSGHTSVTFHSAGYIHRRYGFKYSIPAYALAGFTAASRIDSNKHDLLDVIAGSIIGLGSNLLFTTEYQQKHMELTFKSDEKGFLVGFTYKF